MSPGQLEGCPSFCQHLGQVSWSFAEHLLQKLSVSCPTCPHLQTIKPNVWAMTFKLVGLDGIDSDFNAASWINSPINCLTMGLRASLLNEMFRACTCSFDILHSSCFLKFGVVPCLVSFILLVLLSGRIGGAYCVKTGWLIFKKAIS